MSQSPAGEVVATNELMFLHVDIASERVTPMPPERWHAAARLSAAHAALATPASAGRRIQLRRP
jgi:acyl-CoA thioester hydrolase